MFDSQPEVALDVNNYGEDFSLRQKEDSTLLMSVKVRIAFKMVANSQSRIYTTV
jgi:hypothetical protein